MQHEGEPLRGCERLENHQERETDRVGEDRFLFGVGLVVEADDRLWQPAADVVLLARAARAQHVETDAADDRRQPAPQVGDVVGLGAAQPQPGFLEGVVGLGHRTEHPVGHGLQVRSVVLELL